MLYLPRPPAKPQASIRVSGAPGSEPHPSQPPSPCCHLTGVASEGYLGPAGDSVFCSTPGSVLLDMPSSWLQWLGAGQTGRQRTSWKRIVTIPLVLQTGPAVWVCKEHGQSCVLNQVAWRELLNLRVLFEVILCDGLSWGVIRGFWLASRSASYHFCSAWRCYIHHGPSALPGLWSRQQALQSLQAGVMLYG